MLLVNKIYTLVLLFRHFWVSFISIFMVWIKSRVDTDPVTLMHLLF